MDPNQPGVVHLNIAAGVPTSFDLACKRAGTHSAGWAVLFMTTNRAESVDDAVLSRCVARIDYALPTAQEQARIWGILAQNAGVQLAAGVAETIASKYKLSGRDVKQILKLAVLTAYARKLAEIDVATIEYCMRFKPTEKHDGK